MFREECSARLWRVWKKKGPRQKGRKTAWNNNGARASSDETVRGCGVWIPLKVDDERPSPTEGHLNAPVQLQRTRIYPRGTGSWTSAREQLQLPTDLSGCNAFPVANPLSPYFYNYAYAVGRPPCIIDTLRLYFSIFYVFLFRVFS